MGGCQCVRTCPLAASLQPIMNTTTLQGTILFETDNAMRFQSNEMEDPVWIPLSNIERIHRTKTKGEDKIEVAEWFCEKEELI